jgi:NAD-dependent dihydropyrimidine dehydrogenase PreA subunit
VAEEYDIQINRNRCEGKAVCVAVCPHQVFEVRRIDDADFAKLGLLGKLKSRAHGRRTAYTPRQADCSGCKECVEACPEGAIVVLATAAGSSRA